MKCVWSGFIRRPCIIVNAQRCSLTGSLKLENDELEVDDKSNFWGDEDNNKDNHPLRHLTTFRISDHRDLETVAHVYISQAVIKSYMATDGNELASCLNLSASMNVRPLGRRRVLIVCIQP